MTFIEEKIRIACEKLKEFTEVGWQKLENVEMVRCGYKTENRPSEDGFEPVVNGAPMEFRRTSMLGSGSRPRFRV